MRGVNRFWLFLASALVLVTCNLLSAAEPTRSEEIRAADQALRDKLKQPTKLDVIETPFADVIRDLSKSLDVTIILDPEGLEEADVTPDQLVTLHLEDKRADTILRVLLEPLHLECGVRDGLLVITSEEKYEEDFLAVRVFDVRSLLDEASSIPSKPLPQTKHSAAGIAGGFGGVAAGAAPPAAPAPEYEPETAPDHLVALVCDSVAPKSWTHRGGHGTAKVFAGTLIVRQTPEALDEIADLIQQIRSARTVTDPLAE